MNEQEAREQIVSYAREIYEQGLVNGTGGNLSIRIGDRVVCTPTGWSLGKLDPNQLSVTTLDGQLISGPKATKELPMHLAVYLEREDASAVVHTHPSYSVAYSCMGETETFIPVFTPSIVIKVGPVKLLPFRSPGSSELGDLIKSNIRQHNGLLLENHGVITAGESMERAVIRTFEIEDNLKVLFLSNQQARQIPDAFLSRIQTTYGG